MLRAISCVHTIFDDKLPESVIENMIETIEKLKIDTNSNKKIKMIESINTDDFINVLLEYYEKLKNKVFLRYFKDFDQESTFNEQEFGTLVKGFKAIDEENLKKIFECYCLNRKGEDDKVEKIIRLSSLLSILIDYSLIDSKEIYKTL